MIRILHSSDLHLGKPFGRFPADLSGRLREERHASLSRLAAAARKGGAGTIVVAGDIFDAETPAPATLRQALQAMAAAEGVAWVLMPGNHDSLAASDLWARVAADRPANVVLAVTPEPIALGPAVLIPAPCTHRRPGRDLTEDMAEVPTPEGALRIGLAHGAVQDFSEEGSASLIPPDRAERAGLDYLALGDWHGSLRIGPRCWYSGSPEADSFKHEAAPAALLVTLPEPGAVPEVAPVPTGRMAWRARALDLLPGDDPAALLDALLPPVGARRDTLLRLTVTGRARLSEQAALRAAIAGVEPDFGWFDADLSPLAAEHDTADLDAIDRAGALRGAAEALLAEAENRDLAAGDRALAAAALSRLYGFAREAG